MVKRMLVDATHPEETRVVVLDGTRLQEFDVETSTKKQIKGNIYLAKVVRVEPSLQAAFVDYGGNRHGFLAFSEIHPDYYQIPVADRERLLAEVDQHHDDEDNDDELEKHPDGAEIEESTAGEDSAPVIDNNTDATAPASEPSTTAPLETKTEEVSGDDLDIKDASDSADQAGSVHENPPDEAQHSAAHTPSENEISESNSSSEDQTADENHEDEQVSRPKNAKSSGVETVGGEDDDEDDSADRRRRKFLASRHYKIQEVIKRRQIMLVQVVKEERGNKGAALTSYLSLAGRYCVLMPNSARGGGVSRKITSSQDRRRLKAILGDLALPKSMAVILRTAGAERNKAEIKRDYDYLQRTWNSIRELTMTSRAPVLIHEEASLIKRAIRDIYTRDIEEVWVDGEDGYKTAKDFMKMLTPSHAKKVQKYKDEKIPLFHRYQVETQLEAINNPIVQLKSGGSIVFAQTEALVAIDVNSGRSTKERHIEETAYRTNLEAAEEIARQLRLRDLAGLVVIDFIDMEENRNNHAVERRLKEALRADRARIQVGRISHFGLLELSRQRLRPSLIEANFRVCSHCSGTGLIRSTESAAVHSLRVLEEEGVRHRSAEVTITVHSDVALYLLNSKRQALASIETRYGIKIFILGDNGLVPPDMRIDRVKAHRGDSEEGADVNSPSQESVEKRDSSSASSSDEEDQNHSRADDEDGTGRKRRRRRRKKKANEPRDRANDLSSEGSTGSQTADSSHEEVTDGAEKKATSNRDEQSQRGRRRGRRGGRRRRGGSSKDTTNATTTNNQSEENQQSASIEDGQKREVEAQIAPSPNLKDKATEEQNGENHADSEAVGSSPDIDTASKSSSRLFRTLWKRDSESSKKSASPDPDIGETQELAPQGGNEEPKEAPRRGWWQSSNDQ